MTEMEAMGRHYVVATDGSCKGNPGTGGWAAVVQMRDGNTVMRQRCLASQELFTTNNRMEMLAAINGLSFLKEQLPTIILSDSEYLVLGMNERLHEWKARRWKTSTGPVKNRDLWEQLDTLQQTKPDLDWVKVKGHSSHALNEMADQLASNAARGEYLKGDMAIRSAHPRWFH